MDPRIFEVTSQADYITGSCKSAKQEWAINKTKKQLLGITSLTLAFIIQNNFNFSLS